MAHSIIDDVAFANLFRGNSLGYGVTETGDLIDGKVEATCKRVITHSGEAIPYGEHLNGITSIGVAPLREDGTCEFGALDIDDYDYDLMDIVRAIYRWDLPLIPCWSKSKKLHLYIFFVDNPKAQEVIELLNWYKTAFGCAQRTEVFPKQVKADKFPSWINLPYYNEEDDNNHRKGVKADGSLIPIYEFLARAKEIKQSIKEHRRFIDNLWFSAAPPCVLTGVMLMDVPKGYRNNWMFNVGVYVLLRDAEADYEDILTSVNEQMNNPINEMELNNTVLKGLGRNTYFYICDNMYRCDKKFCTKQEHGIGSKNSTGVTYGEMRQIMTQPPTYEWDINGITMKFSSEQEIMAQTKFRALCMRHLHVVPRHIKDDRWSSILTKAMENIVLVTPDTHGTICYDEGGMFREIFRQYITTAACSSDIVETQHGCVSKQGDDVYFNISWFTSYFYDRKSMKLTPFEIMDYLNGMGCTRHDGHTMKVAIPEGVVIHTREEIAAARASAEDWG